MLLVKKHLVCDVCGKSVSNSCHHLAHMRLHTSGKPHCVLEGIKEARKHTHTELRHSTPVTLVGSNLPRG